MSWSSSHYGDLQLKYVSEDAEARLGCLGHLSLFGSGPSIKSRMLGKDRKGFSSPSQSCWGTFAMCLTFFVPLLPLLAKRVHDSCTTRGMF